MTPLTSLQRHSTAIVKPGSVLPDPSFLFGGNATNKQIKESRVSTLIQ